MGIGIKAKVANHDLTFVRDMGGCPGDKLQIIYRLLGRCVPSLPISEFDNQLEEAVFLLEALLLFDQELVGRLPSSQPGRIISGISARKETGLLRRIPSGRAPKTASSSQKRQNKSHSSSPKLEGKRASITSA
jgi:hypothetical protein